MNMLMWILLLCLSSNVQASGDVYIVGGQRPVDIVVATELVDRNIINTNSPTGEMLYQKLISDDTAIAVVNDNILISYILTAHPDALSKIKIIASVGYDEYVLARGKNSNVSDVFGGIGGHSTCKHMVSQYTRTNNIKKYKFLPYINHSQKKIDIIAGKIIGCTTKGAVTTTPEMELIYQLPDSERMHRLVISNKNIPIEQQQQVLKEIVSNSKKASTIQAFNSIGSTLEILTNKELDVAIATRIKNLSTQ